MEEIVKVLVEQVFNDGLVGSIRGEALVELIDARIDQHVEMSIVSNDEAYRMLEKEIAQLRLKVASAIELAVRYGGNDGAHHKMWVIDRMVRLLAGERYKEVVREAKAGEDGPDTYDWDEGIAP